MFSVASEPPSLPAAIAGYRIERELGRGGFGVVYLAHQGELGRHVALKMIRREFADASASARFRQEAALLAQIDLPHVVRIYDLGVHEGHPFFTMPLMAGGTLRDPERRAALRDPKRAAELVIGLARAVHAVHTHPLRILHRDLKPENILFDHKGQAHISDFGIAKVKNPVGWSRDTREPMCPAYMAPEQAFLDQGELTPAVDVYALGAILYELFTGRTPHGGQTLTELLRRIALEEPIPPRQLAPGLSRDLETVCLNALKRLNARYRSASDFANDLENALQHRPIVARRSSRVDRWVRWVWRHPVSTAVAGVALLLVASVLWLARSLLVAEQERLLQTLDANAFTASGQAGSALFQLRDYADDVILAAQDPAMVALVDNDGAGNPDPPSLTAHIKGFDTLLVLDVEGRPRAHFRVRPQDYFQRRFAFRDYFNKAQQLAERCPSQAYLARAFRSEEDGKIKFGLSAPLMREGRWVGVFVAIIQADSAFGEVQLQDPDGGHLTALLGPRDIDRHEKASPSALTFLVHDGLVDGVEHVLSEPVPAKLREAFGDFQDPCDQFKLKRVPPVTIADYRDPVVGFEGRWLAAIAPVGQTGFVVMVQTRHPDEAKARRARIWPAIGESAVGSAVNR